MTTNMEFCYGLNPIDAEKMRGHFVCVAFNPELRLPSVVGRLYNIDPSTGTIFLFNVKNEAKVNEQEVTPFRIIMKHAVSSVTGESLHVLYCGS